MLFGVLRKNRMDKYMTKKTNKQKAEEYGINFAEMMWRTMRDESNQDINISFDKFITSSAHLAKGSLVTIFPKQPSNLKELELIAYSAAYEWAERLVKEYSKTADV